VIDLGNVAHTFKENGWMIAAIYARKSTGQHVADDAKSVTRQIDNAKAFAATHGWTVGEIFIDDGVSGAETKRLRERARMIAAASNREFDAVIMQAQDRFSRRDGHEAVGELQQLSKHVEVWFYADSQRFESGTFASNTLGFLQAEFAAEYRRAIAAKTTEAMLRKAQQGYVTGGKVFGYENARLNGHVERTVNSSQAAVIKEIYQRYADGEGFKQIAHSLNARKLPSPRPQRGRPAGWDPGTVRAVLKRSLYRGVVIYNRTKKRDPDGSRHRGRQPKKDPRDWITVEKPELALVSNRVAEQVDTRLANRRHTYLRGTKGRLLGRPRGAVDGKHLLAGFLQCACGATFEAVRGYYVCSARRRKGAAVCPSEMSFPVARIDHVFLDALEQTVLSPTFIDRVLDATFAVPPDANREALVQERVRVASEITNLTAAVAQGGELSSLVKALAERDARLKQLDKQLAKPVDIPDREVLKAALELRSGQWRDVLRSQHMQQARLVLQHLIDLPIRILNEPPPPYIKKGDTRGTENIGKWQAQTRPGGLLVGLIHNVASLTVPSWNQIAGFLESMRRLRDHSGFAT